jgi:hypothetical protein
MSTNTPFFEVLGVPAHADTRAVRRAYAALLKRVDPAADPGAFARLREAYEAAMAYGAVQGSIDTTPPVVATVPVETDASPNLPAQPASQVSPEDDLAHTLRLAEGFAVAAQRVPPDQVRALLAATIGDLRLGYIDAPGRFEERMIDLLMSGTVERRDVQFTALAEELHWNEIGRLAPLGSRGRWVEAVLAQEVAWRQVLLKKRAPILELLREAETRLGGDLIPLWPRVRGALEEFPDYLRLILRDARAAEWSARYDALDAARSAAMPDIDAPRSHRPKAVPTARPFVGVGLVLFVVFHGARMLLDQNVSPGPSHVDAAPAPTVHAYVPPHRASHRLTEEDASCQWLLNRFGRYSIDARPGPPAGSEQEEALKLCRQRVTRAR